jgi:hypothetical protein
MEEFWVGFRTDRVGGARNNFAPLWECESGDLSNSTSSALDSDASAGDTAQCTFSGESAGDPLLERVAVAPVDIPQSTDAQRGQFQVLVRARATGTRSYNVRLLDGYKDGDTWTTHRKVRVSNTEFYLYNLGSVGIPRTRIHRATTTTVETYALRLDAQIAATGTGNLRMDTFCLVPRDEGFLYMKGGAVQSGSQVSAFCDPLESWSANAWNGSAIFDQPEFQQTGFFFPTGGVRVVVFGQRSDRQVLGDELKFRLFYFPRYRFLRGAD